MPHLFFLGGFAAVGFLALGFSPEILAAPQGAEDFARTPMADVPLAADPAFAADGDALLDWLIQQRSGGSPYRHLYPIRRERDWQAHGGLDASTAAGQSYVVVRLTVICSGMPIPLPPPSTGQGPAGRSIACPKSRCARR